MFQESDGHVTCKYGGHVIHHVSRSQTSKYGGHMLHREPFKTHKKKKVKILALNVCFAGRKWLLLWDLVLLLNIYQQ